jgi:osmotically-inducible protein OsmY
MAMSRLLLCAGLCLAVLYTAGCTQFTGLKMGTYLNDKNLQASADERFAAERTPELARVKPTVEDGVIYLTGTVNSPEQKAAAERIAFRVPGTRGVVNRVEVQQP